MSGPPAHVAIVGGGISGLAAALALRRRFGPGLRITVYESAPQLGGKLAVSDVAGLPVDEGAEALLARRPEGVALVRDVGLGDDLVPAGTTQAGIWTRGRLRRLPARQAMGVPAGLGALVRSGTVSPRGLLRAAGDLAAPRTREGPEPDGDTDASVGAVVGARLGREVVDRLVDPLLGGVYAGRADNLSMHATMPRLADAASRHRSLLAAAREVLDSGSATGPTFVSLIGGLGRLPRAVARAAGADIRTGATVRAVRRTGTGWQLTVGPTTAPTREDADAVVLAVPARPASRLLTDLLPAAAGELAGLDYASVGTVTLAYRRTDVAVQPAGSGFLVPAVEGRAVKAVTFLSSKWPWLAAEAPGTLVVRCSVGRHGQEAELQADDRDLIATVVGDLDAMIGLGARPVASRVRRWGGALPQYAVGHRQRVARVQAAVAGVRGLAVCGAAYEGLGVPACVASAESAAAQVGAVLPLDAAAR